MAFLIFAPPSHIPQVLLVLRRIFRKLSLIPLPIALPTLVTDCMLGFLPLCEAQRNSNTELSFASFSVV